MEYGYPNISYTGNSATNNNSIISFDHAAKTVFPGISALISDADGNYSPLTMAKPGVDYVRVLGGTERWGDYSGSQRKYNQPGRVWVTGLFGSTAKQNTTWIAELSETSLTSIAEQAPTADNANTMTIYPNPSTDRMNVELQLDKADYLQFHILDAQGKLVIELLRERVKAGKNNFSFSTSPLSAGHYILRVSSAQQELLVQKFQKQ
jgi:hypothetical protein